MTCRQISSSVALKARPSSHHRPAPAPVSVAEVRLADTPLSAVLQGKPSTDEVPVAAWWFLTESLRHSVSVRRAIERVAILSTADLILETNRARLACEAALEEIGDVTVDRMPSPEHLLTTRRTPTILTLRATIQYLARLIVRARPTTTDELRTAILLHLEALRLANE